MISIVTPSQRYENLVLLSAMITDQTYYQEIKEWIIVDGTRNGEKLDLKNLNIGKPIVFIEREDNIKIGRLRNKLNDKCTGDIIVCMDDDDYYPPTRLESACKILQTETIAGCTDCLMFDFILNKQYQFVKLNTCVTNNTLAYRKEYLLNHRYDETVNNGEEFSFTNQFTEKIAQIKPEDTVVMSSHHSNTYDKRHLILNAYLGKYANLISLPKCLIPKKYYTLMRSTFIKSDISEYDIVYMCGYGIKWNPNDTSLGGSEQAVKYLSEIWASKGKKVAVYGTADPGKQNGVDYFNYLEFPYNQKFKTLIVWRYAICYLFFQKLKFDNGYWDLHDNMNSSLSTIYEKYLKNNGPFTSIMFKSQYHQDEFIHEIAKVEKYNIIPNGIRRDLFLGYKHMNRNPYRFCYCSCYSRGLVNILINIWPEIIKIEPKAELHLYYGMDLVDDKFRGYMRNLIGNTKNVMDHGKQPLEIIAYEKFYSTYHLYYTDTKIEIDCISIRESILCGCIPIISTFGVFLERDGLKFREPNEIPKFLGELFNNPDKVEYIRNNLFKSEYLFDWNYVSEKWNLSQ